MVEGALVATLVAESAAHAGALPLLSHVLLQVWRRRRGNALTLAAYEAVGGMAGALERTAEAICAELDERQRQRTRALFLRLIAPGEGTEDTKRRMPRHEIDLDDAELATVVDRFVRARLLLLTEDAIEISHEALIHGWPRLLDWHGRDTDGLNELERRFLAAGHALEARERARSRRRGRLVLVSLIAVLTVVSVLAGVALVQGRQAAQERDLALSRQLALQARAQLELDPAQALRLARQAFQVRPTAEAEAVLRQAVADHRARIVIDNKGRRTLGVAFSGDGEQLAYTDEDGKVRVWPWSGDGVTGTRPTVLPGHDGEAWSPVFSPDGRSLATAGIDGTIRVSEIRGGRRLVLRGHEKEVWTVAFSPDSTHLASVGNDGAVRVWDLTHTDPPRIWRGHQAFIWYVSFGPDGRFVVTAGKDGTVRVWPISTAGEPVTFSGFGASVESVAFSPDGHRLVTTHDDGTVRVWHCDVCGPVDKLAGPR